MRTTGTIASIDGTEIAWTREGSGPPLVMIHCVAVSRKTTPQPTLPAALAEYFTVHTYDRGGKRESINTWPYVVEREFEDMAAIIGLADSPVHMYGFSSGATLALLAAEAGVPIGRLVLLEPPLLSDPDPDLCMRAEAQRRFDVDVADAHRWFNEEVIGVPAEILDLFHALTPEDLANTRTIVHELTFLPGTSAERFAALQTPVLILASDHTAPEILEWADQLAVTMTAATCQVLPGEWYGLDDATLTKAVRDYILN